MTEGQFIREYAASFGVPKSQAKAIVKSVFKLASIVVYDEMDDLYIPGFGSFRHRVMSPRNIVHPKTKEKVLIPSKNVVRFTARDSYDPTIQTTLSIVDDLGGDDED